jgi:prepilin-type processing-associated H-X9-DG protein
LIELLVVIAIIAMLAALLLPAVSRAKESTHHVGCRSNLRQLSVALANYVHDAGGYPLRYDWLPVIEPYTGAKFNKRVVFGRMAGVGSIFQCPSYDRVMEEPPGTMPESPFFWGLGSYAYNYSGVSGWPVATSRVIGLGSSFNGRPVRDDMVMSPSMMISLGDAPMIAVYITEADPSFVPAVGWGDLGYRWGWVTVEDDNPHQAFRHSIPYMKKRHRGHWNVTYCDGHVETWPTKKLFDAKNDGVTKLWNRDNQPHREWISPELLK